VSRFFYSFFLGEDIATCLHLFDMYFLPKKNDMDTQQPGGILGILKGEESLKVEHEFTVAPSLIYTTAGAVMAAMLTVYFVKMVFGER